MLKTFLSNSGSVGVGDWGEWIWMKDAGWTRLERYSSRLIRSAERLNI